MAGFQGLVGRDASRSPLSSLIRNCTLKMADQDFSDSESEHGVMHRDNDCAILLDWNFQAVQQFADVANEPSTVDLPQWLAPGRTSGTITAQTVIDDMMTLLASKSGGRFLSVCLTPNSVRQLGHIVYCLYDIQADPATQHCMRDVPSGTVLVRVACLSRDSPEAVPLNFPRTPSEMRPVFL